MTDDTIRNDLRILVPPPRRPGLLTMLVRWRAEVVITALLVAGVQAVGPVVSGIVAGTIGILVALVPVVRRAAVAGVQTLVVPHRVRAGLVQAPATDRHGRLPWLVMAYPSGDTVVVRVWLRAGVTPADLRRAAPVLATACGATRVEVVQRTPRQDRALLIVVRPRWGWLTR